MRLRRVARTSCAIVIIIVMPTRVAHGCSRRQRMRQSARKVCKLKRLKMHEGSAILGATSHGELT